jgi:RNA polymerase sigma-70 factor (sigma-E family)
MQGTSTDEFARFYSEQFDRMVRLAYLLVGTSSDAEELTQEALSRVQPNFERLDAPVAYARTVLFNLAKRHRSRAARRRLAEAAVARPDVVDDTSCEMWDAIAALPHRQRAVVVLRYYEDLSEAQIAAAMGCRPGTVKSLAARSLARLRRQIGEP